MPKKFDKVQKEKITLTSDDVGTLDATSMLNLQPVTSVEKENVTMNEVNENVDTPAVEATETLKKVGRLKGTKIEHIVKAVDFVPKYRELVAQGKSIDEIANEFKLGKMTVIQKRLAYNKASLAYSIEHNMPEAFTNLPLPKSQGTRGGKKIDWAAFAKKVEDTINA